MLFPLKGGRIEKNLAEGKFIIYVTVIFANKKIVTLTKIWIIQKCLGDEEELGCISYLASSNLSLVARLYGPEQANASLLHKTKHSPFISNPKAKQMLRIGLGGFIFTLK